MSAGDGTSTLPVCFRAYPGAVVLLSDSGVVLDSNGRLERTLACAVRGRPFRELVDEQSSAAKFATALDAARAREAELASADHLPPEVGSLWEFVLAGSETLLEPRIFAVLRDSDAPGFWLIEQRADPRMDRLRQDVTGVNSELANTQRELIKERSRLASTLDALEVQYQETARLALTVQERNEKLARRNRELDEFAHVISHDLKAPLRSIAQYSEWLQEDLGPALPPESLQHLERLRSRVDRLRALVDGVLAYARAGRDGSAMEEVSVEDLLATIIDLLPIPAGASIEIAPNMPVLQTIRSALQQVFLNLIGNAIRYADPADPRVAIEAREVEGGHEFTVVDNGAGIAANQHQRIFTLFHTVEPQEEAAGTGIGLAVVKKLVEDAGGRVWVESEPGEGARFRFLWPTVHDTAALRRTTEIAG